LQRDVAGDQLEKRQSRIYWIALEKTSFSQRASLPGDQNPTDGSLERYATLSSQKKKHCFATWKQNKTKDGATSGIV
jgi:hypothetical protein